MPNQNDTGGARKFSRPGPCVQVQCLRRLRALWLNRGKDWGRLCLRISPARLQEAK